MFGDENLVAVFDGKHRAGIKAHAEAGDMGAKLLRWRLEFPANAPPAVFRIGQVAAVGDGLRRAQELQAESLGGVTGGLDLGGLGGLLG